MVIEYEAAETESQIKSEPFRPPDLSLQVFIGNVIEKFITIKARSNL